MGYIVPRLVLLNIKMDNISDTEANSAANSS